MGYSEPAPPLHQSQISWKVPTPPFSPVRTISSKTAQGVCVYRNRGRCHPKSFFHDSIDVSILPIRIKAPSRVILIVRLAKIRAPDIIREGRALTQWQKQGLINSDAILSFPDGPILIPLDPPPHNGAQYHNRFRSRFRFREHFARYRCVSRW